MIPRAKILCSFHYFKRADMQAIADRFTSPPMIFGDSGAFSAKSLGAEVTVDSYAEWLHKWKDLLTVYVNLDVIRDPEATAANQAALEAKGLNPIPVFHTGSPFDELRRLAETYPYIALGGMVGVGTTEAIRWSATCMKIVEPYGTIFHGFGQTRRKVIEELPWYSVDSSSWGKGHRFGVLDVWTGKTFDVARVGQPIRDMKVRQAIRLTGIDPSDIEDRNKYHRDKAIKVTSWSWQQWEAALQKRHGKQFPHLYLAQKHDQQLNDPGLHVYLASDTTDLPPMNDPGSHLYLAEPAPTHVPAINDPGLASLSCRGRSY